MANLAIMQSSYFTLLPLIIIAVAYLIYCFGLAIYRLYYHPLANIPGPKLAALTRWYEFYFDVFSWPGGKYMYQVEKMHEKYGPIVRVSPMEVHINDRDYFDTLYCQPAGGARDKWGPAARITGTPLGLFGTCDHRIHKARRNAVATFFSKKATDDIEPFIYEKAHLVCEVMQKQIKKYGRCELRTIYLAFSTDIICGHAFDEQMHLLEDDEKMDGWRKTIFALAALTPLVKQFPWLIPVAIELPVTFWDFVYPTLGRVVHFNQDMRKKATRSIKRWNEAPRTGDEKAPVELHPEDLSVTKRPALFQTILSSELPIEEKRMGRMAQEGLVFIGAGGETCARHLSNATYYVLANKERVLPRLKEELLSVMPHPDTVVDTRQLQELPWLTGVVRETLRATALVASRLPLISPFEPLVYGDYTVPPGYPVSMTLRDILRDPEIFTEPDAFRPERWLPSNPDYAKVNKYYIPFSKGTRGCVGINLAYAQLYIMVATLFRNLDIDLDDCDYMRDIEGVRDCFVAEPNIKSKGVFVKAGATMKV